MLVLTQREMHRDGRLAHTHFQAAHQVRAVVLQQQLELRAVVGGEQVRPRERGLIQAGACHEAVGQSGIGPCHAVGAHTQSRVAGPHAGSGRLTGHEAAQLITQVFDRRVVDGPCMRQGSIGVGEGLGG